MVRWLILILRLAAASLKSRRNLRLENSAAVHAIGSGTYRFESTLPETVK